MNQINRFSSRRSQLGEEFLNQRLQGALAYDRIAGYFSSSLLEICGEAIESMEGPIRMVCNSELHPRDVQTASAANIALWKSWAGSEPESLLDESLTTENLTKTQNRFQRLYQLLRSNKLKVKVLPNEAFGLIHGKAGVITLADGSKTSFLGSTNETRAAWQHNYELLWEDSSNEAVTWVQDEFESLWGHLLAVDLSEAVLRDIGRLVSRKRISRIKDWDRKEDEESPNPASVVIESPVYRKEFGLWQHQKHFVNLAFKAHLSPIQKARFVLADQVGLGKTVQLAMAAQLIALTGTKPILIICPKALIWQWQDEMASLLGMPSAVWDQNTWVDEGGGRYSNNGTIGIKRCPRKVGIISSSLITHQTEACDHLLNLEYDCIILDEAHQARRKNLGPTHDREQANPKNLLKFMKEIALHTRSLFLATATPVQIRPVEAWDLLDILSSGDESVLGGRYSHWRNAVEALDLVMGKKALPENKVVQWEWVSNPLPERDEHIDFDVLRRELSIDDHIAWVSGDTYNQLNEPARNRIERNFKQMVEYHNPFIRRIVRRTREQLENQIDPETHEPLLKKIRVELYGESEDEAIPLPLYIEDAYKIADEFCKGLGKGSGFLNTLLLRRLGSSFQAGLLTAQRMLNEWDLIGEDEEEFDFESYEQLSKTLTNDQAQLLGRFITIVEENKDKDPKFAKIVHYLQNLGWLEEGCIIFSQYRESIQWLIEKLTVKFPDEPIALYSGADSSGIMQAGEWAPTNRNLIKERVQSGEIRLLLGTDAASEGLNLQRLGTLINLDLPWNPTRLEQRKGRIQRIGQLNDSVKIYNMRYRGSVEDRVHDLLSERMQNIHDLFGQIPDILEDVWIQAALGEKEQAAKIIDEIPKVHPFEIRYNTKVEPVDWESCTEVLSNQEKQRILKIGWGK